MYCYTSMRSLAAALLLVSLSTTTLCQNIDTAQPILREVSGLANDAYFGYTLALHQTVGSPSNMAEALNGARIIVSAPKATVPRGSLPTTGAVYSCPVNMGECEGLPGKLFDTTGNADDENKTEQFLGASMHSNEERFVVCAHRYARIFSTAAGDPAPLPLGICFYTQGRALNNFQEFVPCASGTLTTGGVGVCQAGTSSVFARQGTLPSSSYALGVGAPGHSNWGGAVIRRSNGGDVRFQGTSGSTERDSYQGYAITSGRFLATDREDFAVSLPKRNLYFGTVNLVRNRNNLDLVSQPLQGLQMGEYYGFSLVAADLNRDGYDDLLVGAPLYRANSTEPETGRVYLYRNTRGNLEFERTIEGRTRYSRFGYAMANIGDVNGDDIDDVAISAPFTETGTSASGTVFIYHGTRTQNLLLETAPSQIIRGTDLSLVQDLSSLRGFGTSLASGVDVDNNGYHDLLVGSFISQQAFLLRTRPLARVTTTVTSDPPIVDVANTNCMLNGVPHACFTVRVCATYTGRGLNNMLGVTYTLSADTQNVERRIIFDANNNTMISRPTTINIADPAPGTCEDFTAYVRNSINDIFNPFIIELSIETPTRTVTPGNGNETPDDLSTAPVVTILGSRSVQVETLKQCNDDGDDDCVPDLRISVEETRIRPTEQSALTSIIAGFTSSVEIFLVVENNGEDAFQADLSFVLPTNVLELVNVFNITNNGEVSLNCELPEILVGENNEPQDLERHSCSIGNPFSGPGSIRLRVQLNPRVGLVGSENDVSINFTVSSINPEMLATINDNSNFALTQMSVEARADVSIDDGVVTPAQISYSNTIPVFNEENPLRNVSQLGAPVDVSFLIRNTGPSRVPTTEVEILWPLNSTLTGENFYLYITSIQSTGAASVTCTPEYINPNGLEGDRIGDQEGGGDPTVSMGTGRRKKRSTVRSSLRKRQEAMPEEVEVSENITLSCASAGPILNCVSIKCTLLGLSGFGSTQIDINSRLDERFFSTNNDRYVFIPTATVTVVSDFIDSNGGSPETSASAQIRIIPAARVQTIGEATPVPWWAIVLPIAAAIIVITVVAVLLWVFGFFRRRKHEEIKQRREELQNLQDNGITPGGPDDAAL